MSRRGLRVNRFLVFLKSQTQHSDIRSGACFGASEAPSVHRLRVLLQLLLLNEAAVVLVNDGEGLLDIFCGLAGQAACLEELLVVKGVSSWNTHVNTISAWQAVDVM